MKRYLFLLVATFSCLLLVTGLNKAGINFTPETENDFIKSLKSSFEKFYQKIPQDRVYLHLDKTFYSPGETIWYSAYLRQAADMKASAESDIIEVQLIAPNGNVAQNYKLVCHKGKAAGDFSLAPNTPGGMYKIRAFSNWQKNEPDTLLFEKEILVQDILVPRVKMQLDFDRKAYGPADEVVAKLYFEDNSNKALAHQSFNYIVQIQGKEILRNTAEADSEGKMYVKFKLPKKLDSNDGLLLVTLQYNGNTESISRSIPVVLNNISLKFYPEGGDLISKIPNKVAFRALNEFGKPADIEGIILDSKGNEVTTFSSFHNGLGSFILPCKEDERYIAKIKRPAQIEQEYQLPEMLDQGYVLNCVAQNKESVELTIHSTRDEELALVAMLRDKIYYSTAVNTQNGIAHVVVPLSAMPMGVCRFTLFDSQKTERAERLVFVNPHKKLNVRITTDKDKYLPREKVTAQILVTDDNGMPTPAQLSLSVTNDELLSFADDKQGNILSQLYLEQDIKGKLDEPAFYFSGTEKAAQAMDYVMLTYGWRRFKWEPILQNQNPFINFKAEKAEISGTVVDAQSQKPIVGAVITIGKKQMQTNGKGFFKANGVDITEKPKLIVKMTEFVTYEQPLLNYETGKTIYLQNKNYKITEETALMDDMQFNMGGAPEANNFQLRREDPGNIYKNKKPLANRADNRKGQKNIIFQKDEQVQIKGKKEMGALVPMQAIVPAGKNKIGRAENLEMEDELNIQTPIVSYYRARQFDTIDYTQIKTTVRTDFRNTIYWNPDIEIDRTGKKTISFYTCDELASFKIITEGIGTNGNGAHAEKKIFTQQPLSLSLKVPPHLIQDDQVSIPFILKNNTNKSLSGRLSVLVPTWLTALEEFPQQLTLASQESKTVFLKYKIASTQDSGKISVAFNCGDFNDMMEQNIQTEAKGFPVQVSFSGKETNKAYELHVSNLVKGSLIASVTAYPSIVSDLLKGVESIFREPTGCFEQTSMSSYPNILVKDYLNTINEDDPKITQRANNLIEKGYQKLITFETKEKGYEWFGGAPGHEALTAYGLMQFNDMKKVYTGVDQKMVDRTAQWLLASRDGKGGYKRNSKALDNFGGAAKNITDAYITYALACANFEDIKVELDNLYDEAKKSNDPYIMGLATNALFAWHKDKRALSILQNLMKKQEADGSFMGSNHSITRSSGKALRVETTSLAVMAMIQSGEISQNLINNAVDFLIKSRNGNGDFGNTQASIMALKALTAYAKYAKKTTEDGTLELYVDGKKVAEKEYKAGEKDAIVIAGVEKYLGEGKSKLELKYKNTQSPLPYSIAVSWHTDLPNSAKECLVGLDVKLANTKVKVGETVRLRMKLENKTHEGLPNTMVVLGIPAGCSVQPWQLKEMTDKKWIDYYEIEGNRINIYYRQMAPSEIKELNFDLKAEVPGVYQSPASCAYLYYTNEYKVWEGLPEIAVIP